MEVAATQVDPLPNVSDQVAYLGQMHATYTEHINNMMSYFLVAAGLVANASVQTFDPTFKIPEYAQFGLPAVGLLISLIFLGIHLRSSKLLQALEDEMRDVEALIFGPTKGFLTNQPESPFPIRMRYLFPAAYLVFAAAFMTLAIVAISPAPLLPP